MPLVALPVGGYLAYEDLATFASRIEPALRRPWRGHELLTCGPWCQGPVLTTALLMLERCGLGDLRHDSADYMHLLIEVLKIAYADREYYYGDPQFVDVPLDVLLSDERIARRIALISRERAMPEMPAAEPDTSYVCVVGRWGNAFSATPSDGAWESPMVPGLGIIPSMRGVQSRPDPRHPSGVAPGKRPRLTPNPALMVSGETGSSSSGRSTRA